MTSIKNGKIKYLILIALVSLCMLFAGCSCDLGLITRPGRVDTPYLMADTLAEELQWEKIDDVSCYDIYCNNKIVKTLNSTADIIKCNYSDLIADNSCNTFSIVAKSSVGTRSDSKKSNLVVVDNRSARKGSASTYSMTKASTNIVITTNRTKITWNEVSGIENFEGKYLVCVFSNTTGYVEIETTSTSFDFASSNYSFATPHNILAYRICAITGEDTAVIISSKINYYNPDGNGYENILFDGYIWDNYINSQEELNAVAYFHFINRDESYNIYFDQEFADELSSNTIGGRSIAMQNALSDAFNSFYETSYYETSNYGKYGVIDPKNNLMMTIAINFHGVAQCDINQTSSNTQVQADDDMPYYKTYDYKANGYRAGEFVSDSYFLTSTVSTSESLYHAIENKVTPICTVGSRAELIYAEAKKVLNEIISDNMSDYEKALSIFDWITCNTTYDYAKLNNTSNRPFTKDSCYYLEGVFIDHLSVCDGFSKAFSMMCNMEGVDSIRIVGTANTGSGSGGHAWNKVKIDGEYYIVDITWTELGVGITENLSHKYFLVSDKSIETSHKAYDKRTKFFAYPTPLDTPIDYYKVNNYSYTTVSGTKQDCTQYIDSDADLKNALDFALYTNLDWVEIGIEYDYLVAITDELNKSNAIDALQAKLKAKKYDPMLITPIYDTLSNTIDFVYRQGKYVTTMKITSTLLVNEDDELKNILQHFAQYAVTNNSVYDWKIEIGFDIDYIRTALNKPLIASLDDIREYIKSVKTQYNIQCNVDYLNKTEKMKINSNKFYTTVYYFSFQMVPPNTTALTSPTNVRLEGDTLRWDAVEYAKSYKIYINNILYIETSELQIDLSDIDISGDHNITVVASASGYIDSYSSTDKVVYIVLEDVNLIIQGNQIYWDAINHATSYEIYMDNGSTPVAIVDATDQTNYSYTIDVTDFGTTHNIYVVAKFGDKTSTSNKVSITKLSQPSISISNNIISWKAITSANAYELYVDNKLVATLTQSSNISNLTHNISSYITEVGTHSIYIKAIRLSIITSNTVSYIASEASNIASVTTQASLDTPSLAISGKTLSWGAIAHASSYEIYVGNSTSPIKTTTATTCDLSSLTGLNGFVTIYIRALSSNVLYRTSKASNSVDYCAIDTFNLTINVDKLSWESVSGATGYDIYINNSSLIASVDGNTTTYTLTEDTVYYEKIWVVAKYNSISVKSNDNVSYITIGNTSIQLDGSIITWGSTTHAKTYEIYINGTLSTIIDDVDGQINYSYDLETIISTNGTYNVYIICSNDEAVSVITSKTNTVVYKRNVIKQLATPNITISGSIISWGAITGATSYCLYNNSNDILITSTSDVTFDLSTLKLTAGDYNIYIKALSTDTNYSTSNKSNVVAYTVEPAPELAQVSVNMHWDTAEISWEKVSGATNYKIYIDNSYKISTTDTYYNINSLVNDYSVHSINIVATDSTGDHIDSAYSETITYQKTKTDTWDLSSTITIYSNGVLSPNAYVNLGSSNASSDDKLMWNKIDYASGYIIYVSLGDSTIYTYNVSNKATTYIFLTSLYSSLSLGSDEIIAYAVTACVESRIYMSEFDSTYYNPYSITTYNTVYAFDGDLNDYYITSQEELNNIVYYNFVKRTAQYEISYSSAMADNMCSSDTTDKTTHIQRAYKSFQETSYYQYGWSTPVNNTMTIANYFNHGSECNPDYYSDNGKTPTTYAINTNVVTYSDLYNYSANPKKTSEFVSDNRLIKVAVTTSEELYFAIENGYTPVCTSGSRAEKIYNLAKNTIKSVISGNMTDFEKALVLFDWISDNTTYDHSYSSNTSTDNMKIPSYYLEGVFMKGVAVCDGYSKAFSMMCNMLGLECIRIVGTAGSGGNVGGHAWNKVKIDGNYYVVDITWANNPGDNGLSNNKEYFTHNYFLTTDAFIASTHTANANRTKFANYSTPSTMYNYYSKVRMAGTTKLMIDTASDATQLLNLLTSNSIKLIDILINQSLTSTYALSGIQSAGYSAYSYADTYTISGNSYQVFILQKD